MTQQQHDRILDRAVTQVRARFTLPEPPEPETDDSDGPLPEDWQCWNQLAGDADYWREYQEYRESRDWRD